MTKYRIDEGDKYVSIDYETNGRERRYVFDKVDDRTVSFHRVVGNGDDEKHANGSASARVPNDVIQQLVMRGWAVYFSG